MVVSYSSFACHRLKPHQIAPNFVRAALLTRHVLSCTLGLSFKWFFLVLHLNSAVVIILKIIPNLYGVYSKIDAPPSFRTRRYFSHHLVRGNSLQDYPLFAGETVGTRIDRDISLIMPLRLRGGYATECHAFSYYPSSAALIFSPPCGSCSVFEVAHTVYKNALIKQRYNYLFFSFNSAKEVAILEARRALL